MKLKNIVGLLGSICSFISGTWLVTIHYIDARIPALNEKIKSLEYEKNQLIEECNKLKEENQVFTSRIYNPKHPFQAEILEGESGVIEGLGIFVTLHFVSTDYAEVEIKELNGKSILSKARINLGQERSFLLDKINYSFILSSTFARNKIKYIIVNQTEKSNDKHSQS